MRISDWSSDVCSSDLDVRWRNLGARFGARQMPGKGADDRQASRPGWRTCLAGGPIEGKPGGDDRRALLLHVADEAREQIGLASQLVPEPAAHGDVAIERITQRAHCTAPGQDRKRVV